MMTEARKSSWAVIGSLTAWVLTFGTLIWNVAVKDANYSSRISAILYSLYPGSCLKAFNCL